MSDATSANLTLLLNRMLRGDQDAGDRALAELHGVLRRAASARLRRERPDHLLETGGLVNEAMLRLLGTASVTVQNRQHFVALVCLLMKRVLIDVGRRKDPVFACLDDSMASADARDRERFLAVEQVLARFERLDPESHEAFRLKTATGMTADEVAEALGCATVTVHRRPEAGAHVALQRAARPGAPRRRPDVAAGALAGANRSRPRPHHSGRGRIAR